MGVLVGLLVGVGAPVGVRVGMSVGVGTGVDVGVCVLVGMRVFVGSEVAVGCGSSHATAATISRTNSPPKMPRVETPIRCLNPNPYRCEPSPLI